MSRCVLIALMGLLSASCTAQHTLKSISIESAADLSHPVAVDIVFVRDPDLTGVIAGLSASDWFAQKARLRQQHGSSIQITESEVVPARPALAVPLPQSHQDAQGVFLFADYRNSQTSAVDLEGYRRLLIRLGSTSPILINRDKPLAATNAVLNRYSELQASFMQDLAGRFPFADPGAEQELALAPLAAFEARYRQNWRTLPQEFTLLSNEQPALRDVAEFLQELDAGLHYLATFMTRNQRLEVPFTVQVFPAADHPRHRHYFQQLVEIVVETSTGRVTIPGDDTDLVWHSGDPVGLALRWATGSTHVPVADPRSTAMVGIRHVEAAVFSAEGSWALFRWLSRGHRGEDGSLLVPFDTAVAPRTDRSGDASDLLRVNLAIRIPGAGPPPPFPAGAPLLRE